MCSKRDAGKFKAAESTISDVKMPATILSSSPTEPRRNKNVKRMKLPIGHNHRTWCGAMNPNPETGCDWRENHEIATNNIERTAALRSGRYSVDLLFKNINKSRHKSTTRMLTASRRLGVRSVVSLSAKAGRCRQGGIAKTAALILRARLEP
jgi:hypothetical protein